MSSKEFEIARMLMLRAFLDGVTNDEAQAFAWSSRVYPLRPGKLDEAFKDDFDVGQADVERVLTYLDEKWTAKTPVTFYEVESHFARSGIGRVDLIDMCRLFHLSRLFDQPFRDGLTANAGAPVEANGINRPFDRDDDINL